MNERGYEQHERPEWLEQLRAERESLGLAARYERLDTAVAALRPAIERWEVSHPGERTAIIAAGPTGAGKGRLVDELALPEAETTTLSLDRYYLGREKTIERLGEENYSVSEALDNERLMTDVNAFLDAKEGETVSVPVYSMRESRRTGEEPLPVRRRLVIDGVYGLSLVAARTPFRIYVEVTETTMLERKIPRDSAERGIAEAVVRERFDRDVRPSLKEHVEPQRELATIVVRNDEPIAER